MSDTDELYDTDILEWSERQAALLRRLAAGERVNDHDVDWPNIVEEIESVGRDQLRAVESFLVQAIAHMLKAEGWPSSRDAPNWLAESRRFQGDAASRFAPSMRPRIDLERVYRRALSALPATMDGQAPLPIPAVCPFTLEELLSDA
jgi:hypothetical protein